MSSTMPTITVETFIAAPIERVFDLARSIDLHRNSATGTGEQAVAGVTTGLIGLHQDVTWRARHFGIRQTLTVRVTEFNRPTSFVDVMVHGAFRSMEHAHIFETSHGGTTMRDEFTYISPLGILGRMADWLFLKRYLQKFISERNRVIKDVAESDKWKSYAAQV